MRQSILKWPVIDVRVDFCFCSLLTVCVCSLWQTAEVKSRATWAQRKGTCALAKKKKKKNSSSSLLFHIKHSLFFRDWTMKGRNSESVLTVLLGCWDMLGFCAFCHAEQSYNIYLREFWVDLKCFVFCCPSIILSWIIIEQAVWFCHILRFIWVIESVASTSPLEKIKSIYSMFFFLDFWISLHSITLLHATLCWNIQSFLQVLWWSGTFMFLPILLSVTSSQFFFSVLVLLFSSKEDRWNQAPFTC